MSCCMKSRCRLFCLLLLAITVSVVFYVIANQSEAFRVIWPAQLASSQLYRLKSPDFSRFFGKPSVPANQNDISDMKSASGPQIFRIISGSDGAVTQKAPAVAMPTGMPMTTAVTLTKDLTRLHRLVHLDLKGAAPKVSFYKTLFSFLKQQGATGLLIEYEDMFPYSGELSSLKSGNAYSEKDIDKILSLAKENGFLVIPLVQTFGHLEFVLKNEEFASIRELINKPQNLNPALEKSKHVVTKMVEQVLSLHPEARWIHIGCDEVYYLGMSSESKALMKKEGLTKQGLFLHHVTGVAKFVNKKFPKVRPIIWDDMMRSISMAEIQKSGIARLIEPMIWRYTHDLDYAFQSNFWAKYAQLFENVWAASSFKGATGPSQIFTNHSYHLENHRQWVNIINRLQDKTLNFRGVALTGWQRYDHFATLCELLPASFPSLSMCLDLLQIRHPWTKNDTAEVYSKLDCWPGKKDYQILHCYNMPGNEIFVGVQKLRNLLKYYYRAKENADAWFNSYQVSRGFLSPGRLDASFHGPRYNDFIGNMTELGHTMKKALDEIYEDDDVMEWLELNIWSKVREVEDLHNRSLPYLKLTTWQRRPLPLKVPKPKTQPTEAPPSVSQGDSQNKKIVPEEVEKPMQKQDADTNQPINSAGQRSPDLSQSQQMIGNQAAVQRQGYAQSSLPGRQNQAYPQQVQRVSPLQRQQQIQIPGGQRLNMQNPLIGQNYQQNPLSAPNYQPRQQSLNSLQQQKYPEPQLSVQNNQIPPQQVAASQKSFSAPGQNIQPQGQIGQSAQTKGQIAQALQPQGQINLNAQPLNSAQQIVAQRPASQTGLSPVRQNIGAQVGQSAQLKGQIAQGVQLLGQIPQVAQPQSQVAQPQGQIGQVAQPQGQIGQQTQLLGQNKQEQEQTGQNRQAILSRTTVAQRTQNALLTTQVEHSLTTLAPQPHSHISHDGSHHTHSIHSEKKTEQSASNARETDDKLKEKAQSLLENKQTTKYEDAVSNLMPSHVFFHSNKNDQHSKNDKEYQALRKDLANVLNSQKPSNHLFASDVKRKKRKKRPKRSKG